MDQYSWRDQDKTIDEEIVEARAIMCNDFCKYTDRKKHGLLSQQTLDEICKHDCPIGKF